MAVSDVDVFSDWKLPQRQERLAEEELARSLGVPPVFAALLHCRGLGTTSAAHAFLHPQLSDLHDPFLMLGMQAAVERLRMALQKSEPILIYGDYDVDGTVATVLLKVAVERAATSAGLVADVRFHIPHRIHEGYGMQERRMETAAAEGVRLVVSVDTGIRAFAAAAEAKRLGLDLIVTDHHLPDDANGVPAAVAILNPNQPGCNYPYKELCGAGVAFKLAQALLESSSSSEEELVKLRTKTLPSFLKLLSIATIADAVPLTGENRVIAHFGLRELRRPAQHGLRALMELAGIDVTRPLSATDVGFRIAPRINAAGRMDIASDVVDMFLEQDPSTARALAEKLHALNEDRRTTEAEALKAIDSRLESMSSLGGELPACIVLDDASWHRGVIGILASRVVDRTNRPALVISHEGGQAYGSGRSVAGYHLLQALTEVHELGEQALFSRFGGHAHAVGFSLDSSRVWELRDAMAKLASRDMSWLANAAMLHCDVVISLEELTPQFLDLIERLGPFGHGNPEPVFISRNVQLAAPVQPIKERHLRVLFEQAGSRKRIGGVIWSRRILWAARASEENWLPGQSFDIAYRMHRNWHPNFGGWELDVVHMRRTEGAPR